MIVYSSKHLSGTVQVPGDKSFTHRIMILGSLADGISTVQNWLSSGDTLATLQCIRQLGTEVRITSDGLSMVGGMWKGNSQTLNMRHAGTGIRLLAGALCGQSFSSVLDGSEQLRRRPMKRIVDPLQRMGAKITSTSDKAPLFIEPSELHGIEYKMDVSSAQVKSAILLAGLFAEGITTVIEKEQSRDHTERLFKAMSANIQTEFSDNQYFVHVAKSKRLQPIQCVIPGDFSSASFLLVAGCLVENSEIIIQNVNLNPTRTGLFSALLEMGANCQIIQQSTQAQEPVGTLVVKTSVLRGITIPKEWVVRMIDEFPIFMVAALFSEGTTVVRDAKELRVKESDRLKVMTQELRKMGAIITEWEDGFEIIGRQTLHGAVVESHDDHRIAMSLAIAGLLAKDGTTTIMGSSCTEDSFPNYVELIQNIGGNARIC